MAWIAGVSVPSEDAHWLIDQLRAVGRADDVTAAHAIERAITRLAAVDDLTPLETDAVLAALIDPPDGLLRLRARLARNHRHR